MKEATSATLPESALLCQSERTACRVIDGKAVVITIDHNQVHVFNSVGTRVWELADGRPLDAIVDAIVGEFEVEPERARLDVYAFAERLVALGAASIQAGAPQGRRA